MTVEPGQTYESKTRRLIVLVVRTTEKSARCFVVWNHPREFTGYRAGEVSTWDKDSLEKNWKRLG